MELKTTCRELLDTSPVFAIEDGDAHAPPQSLSLFDTTPLPGRTAGTLAFVGGPTTALDWHPDGRHFALAASRAAQPFHRALYSYSGAAHIQVWSALETDDDTSSPILTPVTLLPHTGDTAWEVRWRPSGADMLAACLADGSLHLYEFANGPSLATTTSTTLRTSAQDGARTAAWRADGNLLAAGTARGCIELYAVRQASAQLLTRVRAHEFIVARLAWLSTHALSSVGHDGTLRVRDVREPAVDVEALSDGLAWNTCLTTLEPAVAVAGTDNGFIKAAHLASLAPGGAPSQFRRKRVQTGSLRDCVAMPLLRTTALFIVGGEGTLFQGSLPRPLYRRPPPGSKPTATGAKRPPCGIGRYFQVPIMQWAAVRKEEDDDVDRVEAVPLDNNGESDGKTNEEYRVRDGPLVLRLTDSLRTKATERMLATTTSKVKIHVRTDVNLCADDYDQRAVLMRVALSISSNMIAVGTHAGLLTVLTLSEEMRTGFKPAVKAGKSKPKTARSVTISPKKVVTPKKPAKPTKMEEEVLEIDLKPKKRGRPRKYPTPLAVWAASCVIEEIVAGVVGETYDQSKLIIPRRAGKPVRRKDDARPTIDPRDPLVPSRRRSRKAARGESVLLRLRLRAANETKELRDVSVPLRLPLRKKERKQNVLLRLPLRKSAVVTPRAARGVSKRGRTIGKKRSKR